MSPAARVWWVAVFAAALAACSGSTKPADGTGAAGPLRGQLDGGYFYPEFQRLKITAVKSAPSAQVPAALAGRPAALRGRSVYLSNGYLTLPATGTGQDLLVPACFKPGSGGLEVQPVFAGEHGFSSLMLAVDSKPLSAYVDKLFEVTLELAPAPADEGYQRRAFDETLNSHIAHEIRMRGGPTCQLAAAATPALINHDLALEAPELGRRHVDKGADLDVHSAIPLAVNISKEWRRALDPADPRNRVSGCIGNAVVTRILALRSGDNAARIERRLVESLVGSAATGESCERVRQQRRIDPARLLLLFDVAIDERLANSGQKIGLELARWEREGVFVVEVNGYELELTTFAEPRLQVKLVRRAAVNVAPATSVPAAAPPRESGAAFAQPASDAPPAPADDADADRPAEKKMYRWVDRDGTVHYSDRPRGGG